jgi:RNA polymerase sigma-70 factor (ECF subfamily)
MRCLPTQEHTAEQEILAKLKSPGIIRMKGEEQLFKKYFYFIRYGRNKYSLTEDNLFDAYSDTIIAAIRSITDDSFQKKSSLKTFLYQIFHNRCVDILRKKTALKSTINQTVSINEVEIFLSDNSQSVIDQLIKKADAEAFKQQINQLCSKSQRLMLLAAEGYTDKEIAIKMNFKTRDVVKTSRLRCMRTLRLLNRAC